MITLHLMFFLKKRKNKKDHIQRNQKYIKEKNETQIRNNAIR